MESETPSNRPFESGDLFSHRMLDDLLEGVQLISPDYRYLYVNRTVANHGRSTPEALLGRTMMETYPGIENTAMFACLRRCIESRFPQQMENQFTFLDGSTGWFELRFEPVQGGVVILSVDVTARKRAEERIHTLNRELQESKARIRAIYDHLPNAIFVWQRQGSGFALVDHNVQARSVTEGRVLELLGSPPEDLEDNFPNLVQDLTACFDERNPIRREEDCRFPGTKAGRRLVLTYGFVPADMVILHAEDVTDRRRTEDQLRVAQRLEAVGRLAGGVAHDFNNLLNVVISYSGFAIDELRDSDPIRSDLVEVQNAGQRAASLTRQLLAFSRRQVLQPEVLSLNKIISGLEEMLRRLLGEDIDIQIRLADDLGCVEADPGQIEQIIMNLAVNARDAMPEGGELLLQTSNAQVDEGWKTYDSELKPGRYAILSVSDTGVGMDSETFRRIFEPFFTTKEKGRGTGLGLSTVYGITKQSGGDVWVYSEPRHGTTFKVYLPRVEGVVAETKPRPSSTLVTGRETVLVVEDDDVVRKLTERILRTAGYQVLSAADGGEALLRCEQNQGPVDLLLTDVVLPKVSGRELAERLTKRFPGLKVLFTSGYTENTIVHHGVLDRETRFIEKPFSAAELTEKVRQVLDEGSSAISSLSTL